jgi:hypothetical protein
MFVQPGLTMEGQTANGRSDKDSMRGAGGNQSPIRELELTLDVTIELVAPGHLPCRPRMSCLIRLALSSQLHRFSLGKKRDKRVSLLWTRSL